MRGSTLALKLEEGATSQEMQVASGATETDSFLKPPKKNTGMSTPRGQPSEFEFGILTSRRIR